MSCFAQSENVLFKAEFQGDVLDSFPAQDWSSSSRGDNFTPGSVEVRQDTSNWFGEGTGKRYLHARDGQNFTLSGQLSEPREVVVLRTTIIPRNTPNDNRWLNFNFLAGNGTDRAHVFSLNLIGHVIRDLNISYGGADHPIDFSVVMNNNTAAIDYTAPGGHTIRLASARADVWVDGELRLQGYVFARAPNGTGPIRAISIQADSTAVTSFDLARVEVLDGAVVAADPVPAPPPPMVTIGGDGRLVYSEDSKGNRIPDFSNAGYMGGGVPIPDVEVAATVFPQAGDNRSGIQAAINHVSGLPLNEEGFRGAVLLKAGEHRVSGPLRIQASGVVLRGEGDGPDGTIIRATGAYQHDVIEVSGTGQWQQVSGTRRDIVDTYVPVGARSFHVTDASGYSVGDTIIVYRPSTAEWISAIGMDQIPPRSDGLPVTQWTAGSRDLRFDRVITAIEGNRITVDAPLVNALEEEFGGGYIYRYTYPGRISQVGIEHIRAISDYSGGPWTTSRFDEEHAWTFVVFDRVQNAWVRNTTALHFAFGNTHIRTFAKWVTVQDSQNLFPVSQITGSRRYPFYVQGQLCLVQRCYANYARHDYGTSSLTHGPNVFLDSSGDHSYNDTGPHHRWATGALYDNISVPNRDIAVQNRLNFGSGHGWAGANHVIWNSTANRIVVQNPPTAQNWAIGVIGNKWEGAFPAYAEDGYWISHGARVEPSSLYLKQLEDRLAPEGAGGGIATVVFGGQSAVELTPGAEVHLPIVRFGTRDGMTRVRFVLDGDGADLVDAPEVVSIPAYQVAEALTLRLREDAVVSSGKLVTVRLIHDAGYSVGNENTVAITIPSSPFHAWRAEMFSPSQLEDAGISGPEASPAGDGVSNLLKYALNLSPFTPAMATDLPRVAVSDNRLTLTFTRGESRSDIDYVVEVSTDLRSWSSGGAYTEEIAVSGEGDWKSVTVGLKAPVDAAERNFMRLRVVPK